MAAKKPNSKSPLSDVAASVSKSINKTFKDAAFVLHEGVNEDNSASVTDWIPTGCRPLDIAISNLPDRGGFPCGRITVLWGPESAGKSLLAMHAIANTQKMGGHAIYIDAEHAIHLGFATALGVDLSTLDYSDEQSAELIFDLIEKYSIEFRKHYPDKLLTIVVDSIASLTTDANVDNGHVVSGYDTSLPRLMSSSLKLLANIVYKCNVALIFTNQARLNMQRANVYDSKWKQYGGQSSPHYVSLSIFMEKSRKLKAKIHGVEEEVGAETRVVVEKNRLGPPPVKMSIDVYYDRGIDDYYSWFEVAKKYSECEFTGAWISYTTSDGRMFKENGWASFCKKVLEPYPNVADEIWKPIAQKMVRDYKRQDGQLSPDAEIIRVNPGDEIDGVDDTDTDTATDYSGDTPTTDGGE